MKKRFALLAVLGVLGALFAIAAFAPAPDDEASEASSTETAVATTAADTSATKPKPKTKPTRYGQLFVKGMTPQKAARPLCGKYAESIDSWDDEAEAYLAASARAVDDDIGYDAAAFLSTSGPYRGKTAEQFAHHVEQLALQRLKAVTRPRITRSMLENFTKDSLFVCQLGAEYKETLSELSAATGRSETVEDYAAKAPWYPEGWTPAIDGVAYRWIQGNDCGYSSGYCWGMHVISRHGCPDGLYVELNIVDSSGTVIDYSNDALGSLPAGQQGKLDFSSFQEGYGTLTAQLTDVNCY